MAFGAMWVLGGCGDSGELASLTSEQGAAQAREGARTDLELTASVMATDTALAITGEIVNLGPSIANRPRVVIAVAGGSVAADEIPAGCELVPAGVECLVRGSLIGRGSALPENRDDEDAPLDISITLAPADVPADLTVTAIADLLDLEDDRDPTNNRVTADLQWP